MKITPSPLPLYSFSENSSVLVTPYLSLRHIWLILFDALSQNWTWFMKNKCSAFKMPPSTAGSFPVFFTIKISEWVLFLFGELHTIYVDLDLEFLVNVLVQITFRGAPLIFKWWKLNWFMNAEEMFSFWNSLHIILHFHRYNMKKSLFPCECGQSDYLQRNFIESKLN